jgi:hypothetical protein
MEKRIRSPNYPALSLGDALNKVSLLYKNLHNHPGPREVIAKGMGYASLNGSSMTAISALHKYGLLEGRGDEIRVSNRAMRIMHPESEEERSIATKEAASEPDLFRELDDRFPGAVPNEELLRNYLLRRNFAPSAVSQVILSYRETKELVGGESDGYDSSIPTIEGSTDMHSQATDSQASALPGGAKNTPQLQRDERSIGRYDFEDGGYIRISVGGSTSTEEALDMAETIIDLKRKEIERRKKMTAVAVLPKEDDSVASDDGEQNA